MQLDATIETGQTTEQRFEVRRCAAPVDVAGGEIRAELHIDFHPHLGRRTGQRQVAAHALRAASRSIVVVPHGLPQVEPVDIHARRPVERHLGRGVVLGHRVEPERVRQHVRRRRIG